MRPAACQLARLGGAGWAWADDVHLTNGQVFEGVAARAEGEAVVVRLPGGSMRLPLAQVARIVPSVSRWEEYLAKREALARDPDAHAAAWLDLARWSQRQGLEQGYREAALRAGELEPTAAAVAPILRALGYSLDLELGRWLPYEEAMLRRGFVRVRGQWLSPAEAAERARERRQLEAEESAARDRELSRQMVRAAETLLLAEAMERRQPPPQPVLYGGLGWAGWPIVFVPAPPTAPHSPPRPMPAPPERRPPARVDGIGGRQPGSILPIDSMRSETSDRGN